MTVSVNTTTGEATPADESGLGWRRLALVAGIAASVAMAATSFALSDLEGWAVTAGFAISTFLVRVRRGTIGAIGLTLAGAVTLYFMATAAITNIRSGSDLTAVLVTAALTAVSLVAAVAAVGFLARRDRSTGRGPWLAAGLGFVVFASLGSWGAATGVNAAASGDIELASENLAFSQTQLTAQSGEITLVMENKDLFWHTFTIEELGVDLRVPLGAEMAVTFDAEPGQYQFICAIPGHPEAGMVGTLTVEG